MSAEHDSTEQRSLRAQEVATAWWRRQAAGERVPEADLIDAHPELMPELGEQIRFLRMMQPLRRVSTQDSSLLLDIGATQLWPRQETARDGQDGLSPGDAIADRYVICNRLGEGGLGIVYLAHDRSLRKPVAIKVFRDLHVADDSPTGNRHSVREQMIHEVQLAQRVSHPNVCRIHDLVLDSDPPVLTMEYIDGEDLDRTLLRIERLVPDRALQISTEICRGLAAAHQQGVIHQDLKPRNIMLDSAGLVRITDFGLARVSFDGQDNLVAGTRAYMAPEQIRGDVTNERSDIYSMGLVLYELFTGVHPFAHRDVSSNEQSTEPVPPSAHVPEIPRVVEQTILQCLRPTQDERPESAREVLSQLTGRALRAGKKDSRRLPAATVRVLVFLSLAGILASWFLSDRYQMMEFVDFKFESIGAYRERATTLISDLGYEVENRADRVTHHFDKTGRFRNEPTWANRAVSYWYRQSSERFPPKALHFAHGQHVTRINSSEPPWILANMVGVELSPAGTLLDFRATPGSASRNPEVNLTPEKELAILFTSAGLDVADYQKADKLSEHDGRATFGPLGMGYVYQQRNPLEAVRDPANAQTGPNVFVKLDQGRVTRLRLLNPTINVTTGTEIGDAINDLLFLVMLAIGATGCWVARRNFVQRTAELRGAAVSAGAVFVLYVISLLFTMNHDSRIGHEVNTLEFGLFNSVFWAGVQGILYLALEPLVRRERPQLLTSWSRFIHGDFRDRQVVFHILIAVALATTCAPIIAGGHAILRDVFSLPTRYGIPDANTSALVSPGRIIPMFCDTLAESMYFGLGLLLLPMALKRVLGDIRIAVPVAWLINSVFYGSYFGGGIEPFGDRMLFYGYMSIWAGLHLFVVLRFGLLAGITYCWISDVMFETPFTMDRWYANSALVTTIVLTVSIVAYSGWYLSRPSDVGLNGSTRTGYHT